MFRGRIAASVLVINSVVLVILYIFRSTHTVPLGGGDAEVQRVVFAKVHKAASTTVQNVLLRFAMARDLNILLPIGRDHLNEFDSKIEPDHLIEHQEGKPFDILCNHIVFNEDEIAAYIPRATSRFGILREPLSQALSALKFYMYTFPYEEIKRGVSLHSGDPVQGFLSHPEDFCNEHGPRPLFLVDNRMSVDLGFNTAKMFDSKRNRTIINEFLARLDSQFDLMLISEYFDESMVLLRRLLNWQLRDILYVKINAQKKEKNSVWHRDAKPTASQLSTFRQWAAVDIALYDHFLAKFLREVESAPYFKEEVRAFKEIRSSVEDYCKLPVELKPGIKKIPAGRWTREFSIFPSDCKQMMSGEKDLVKLARTRQLERLYKAQDLTKSSAP